MAFPLMAAGVGLGALGGLIGGLSDDVTKSTVTLDPAQQFEKDVYGFQNFDFNQLRNLIGAGPGQQDIASALAFNRQVGEQGLLPSAGDIARANQYTGDIFAAEREALGQSFYDQTQESMRQRALMGRSGADPILQAKLAQEQTRQERMLGSQERGFAAQFAQGLAGQRGDMLNQLAQQAQANRLALLQTGSSLLGAERDFRLQTAERTNVNPGSFGKGLAGAIGGAGSGLQAVGNFQAMQSYSGALDRMGRGHPGAVKHTGSWSGFTPMGGGGAPAAAAASSIAMGPAFASAPTYGPFPSGQVNGPWPVVTPNWNSFQKGTPMGPPEPMSNWLNVTSLR